MMAGFEDRLTEAVRQKDANTKAWMQISPEERYTITESLRIASQREIEARGPEVWDAINKESISKVEAFMRMSPEAQQASIEQGIIDDIVEPPWTQKGVEDTWASLRTAIRRDVESRSEESAERIQSLNSGFRERCIAKEKSEAPGVVGAGVHMPF